MAEKRIVIVPEVNYSGQFANFLLARFPRHIHRVNVYRGQPMRVDFLVDQIKDIIAAAHNGAAESAVPAAVGAPPRGGRTGGTACLVGQSHAAGRNADNAAQISTRATRSLPGVPAAAISACSTLYISALRTQGIPPHQVVCVSGIGCSSRIPYFINAYGFHGIHGRTMPIATGVRLARPDLKTLVFGGDGDAFAIGAGHFVHAMRRNVDLCYVVMDNATYGLTKGQTSPTSGTGFVTLSTPHGNPEQALNPMLLALASGATFVAPRGFSADPQKLADLIVEGMNHKGFAFIDVYSPCVVFNKVNTFKYYKEQTEPLPKRPRSVQLAGRHAAGHQPRPALSRTCSTSARRPPSKTT